jgi:hypothetical protein
VDINEPIRLDDELVFCEVGNRLALQFLRKSREAVKQATIDPSPQVVNAVSAALRELFIHCSSCPYCNED